MILAMLDMKLSIMYNNGKMKFKKQNNHIKVNKFKFFLLFAYKI